MIKFYVKHQNLHKVFVWFLICILWLTWQHIAPMNLLGETLRRSSRFNIKHVTIVVVHYINHANQAPGVKTGSPYMFMLGYKANSP